MASDTSSWVKRNPLIAYIFLAYMLTWAVEIPLALEKQGLIRAGIPFSVHYCAAFGPMLAALIVTAMADGRAGLRELAGRMFRWRLGFFWWLIALSPLLLFGLVSLVLRSVQGAWREFEHLGQVDFLPDLGVIALFLWILTFGFGEETGWRGFALPRLQKGRSALSATLILWVVWAFWHLPAFFYLYDPSITLGFLLGMLAGAIVFTWLYNSVRGSILIVAVWHGAFNLVTGCTACKAGVIAAILSTLVMIWAVLALVLFRPATLSREEKQVL